MAAFQKLFGNEVVNHKGEKLNTADLANNEVVGVYFSAHWCGPCRKFTPMLAELYNQLKKDGKKFEIVFVSGDNSEDEFKEYFETMPWLAVPYTERSIEEKLSGKYDVQGIPSLVLLNKDGRILHKDGRSVVSSDPKGAEFPWPKKSVFDMLKDQTFVNNKGDKVDLATIRSNEAIGIYFSAHWCPPCRGFTPELIKTYNKVKAAGKKFEIIFASSDRDQHQFDEYFKEMPWLAIPFPQRDLKGKLSQLYGVEGIPTFIIIDPTTGNVINEDGRSAVMEDPEGASFPWVPPPPQPLEEASSRKADLINEGPVALLLLDGVTQDDVKNNAKNTFEGVAKKYFDKFQAQKPADEDDDGKKNVAFMWGGASHELVTPIRNFTNLNPSADPQLVLLDVKGRKKYVFGDKLEADSISKFVEDYLAGSLKSVGIKD